MNKKIKIIVSILLIAAIIISIYIIKYKTQFNMSLEEERIINLRGKKLEKAFNNYNRELDDYIDIDARIVTMPEVVESLDKANFLAQEIVYQINDGLEEHAQKWNYSYNHKNDPISIIERFSFKKYNSNEMYYEYIGDFIDNQGKDYNPNTTTIVVRIIKKSYFDFEKLNKTNITKETVKELGDYLYSINHPYESSSYKFLGSFIKENEERYVYTAYYIVKGIYQESPMSPGGPTMYTLYNLSFEVDKNDGETTIGKEIGTDGYNIKYYKPIFEEHKISEYH